MGLFVSWIDRPVKSCDSSYLRIFCSWQHFWCSIIFVGPVTDIEDHFKKVHALQCVFAGFCVVIPVFWFVCSVVLCQFLVMLLVQKTRKTVRGKVKGSSSKKSHSFGIGN